MIDQDRPCTNPSPELKRALVAYLYDECEPDERTLVEQHVEECRHCAGELESLQAVRGTLGTWAPPQQAAGFRVVAQPATGRPWREWWRSVVEPSWGLAAATAIVLVAGVAIAGLEVRYDSEGFAFRVGRVGLAPENSTVQAGAAAAAVTPGPGQDDQPAPWLTDLTNLERELRRDLTTPVATPVPVGAPGPTAGPDPIDQVRGLIAQSERRQRQELALWFTEFAQEFDMQRRADQQRVQRELGALEGYADYLVRTSGR